MNIKTFKDGNRLVVIFEDLENMPAEDDMIKSYISSITSVSKNINVVTPAYAEPINVEDNIEIPLPVITSTNNLYNGKNVAKIMSEGDAPAKNAAFEFIKNYYSCDSNQMTFEEISVMKEYVVNGYKDIDIDAYLSSLTTEQKIKVFNKFFFLYQKEVETSLFSKYGTSAFVLTTSNETALNEAIKLIAKK